MEKAIDEIMAALRRIQEEGGDMNWVIFHADRAKNFYVQCAAECGGAELRAEAVGRRYAKALSAGREPILLNLGWVPAGGNLSQTFSGRTHEVRRTAAETIFRTLVDVYGLDGVPEIEINLE